jgi:hypothetical protein
MRQAETPAKWSIKAHCVNHRMAGRALLSCAYTGDQAAALWSARKE